MVYNVCLPLKLGNWYELELILKGLLEPDDFASDNVDNSSSGEPAGLTLIRLFFILYNRFKFK